MGIVTNAAHELIDDLHCAEVRYQERIAKSQDDFERGLFQGYLDSTRIYIEFAEARLEAVEQEARLIPENEDGITDIMLEAHAIVQSHWPAA